VVNTPGTQLDNVDAMVTMTPTLGPITFSRRSAGQETSIPRNRFSFGQSEVFGAAADERTVAYKQLWRDTDGRTYLVESLGGEFLAGATYPLVWDYQTKSSTLSADEDWWAHNTYYVSSDLTLGVGVRLRIEPGTVVKFNNDPRARLDAANGVLEAQGRPYDYIVFTSKNDDAHGETISGSTGVPALNDWSSLTVDETGTVRFCKILYAQTGLYAKWNGSPTATLEHNIIAADLYGIHVTPASGVSGVIRNNLTQQSYYGLFVTRASGASGFDITIAQNTVDEAQFGIVTMTPEGTVEICNNLLTSCAKGIADFSGSDPNDDPDEHHNAFYDCTFNVIYYAEPQDPCDVDLSVSPYDTTNTVLGSHYLNTNAQGGQLIKDAGYGQVADYFDEPDSWSIYHPSGSRLIDSPVTHLGSWEAESGTCDTGPVAIGYHHPRVDYVICDGGTVALSSDPGSSRTLHTIEPGTVVACELWQDEPSNLITVTGCDEFLCQGDPYDGAYVTFVQYGRASQWATTRNNCTQNLLSFSGDSRYELAFAKFIGLACAVSVKDGGVGGTAGTIRDCVFRLSDAAIQGQETNGRAADLEITNCLFYNNMFKAIECTDSDVDLNVSQCTFADAYVTSGFRAIDHVNTGSSATVRNCLFALTGLAGGICEVENLTESHNAFYRNSFHIFGCGTNYLDASDWAYPAKDNATTLACNPRDDNWSDFADRFCLAQDCNAVDTGHDPCSLGMVGYTTALSGTADVSPLDIGYHYPLPVDTDGDGLRDYQEYWLGSDPNDVDSDDDGLVDGTGSVVPTDSYAAGYDRDGDGYVDGEQDAGTDPLNAHSDYDGVYYDTIADGWEWFYGLDPVDGSDADDDDDTDGLDNQDEYNAGTVPTDPDTDDDGMADGWEHDYGTQPLVNDAEGDLDSDTYTNWQEYVHGTAPDDDQSTPAPMALTVPTDVPTIQSALDGAIDGDVITVLPATYDESLDFLGKAVTVRGSDPTDWQTVEATVVDAQGLHQYVAQFTSGEGPDSVLTGLTLTGATNYAVFCNQGGSTVTRCVIEGNAGGVLCLANGTAQVRNNLIRDNAEAGAASVFSGATMTLQDNWIYDNSYGVWVGYTGSAAVAGNTIVGNTTAGVYQDNAAQLTINNCVFADNADDLYACSCLYSCIQNPSDLGDPNVTGNLCAAPCFVDAPEQDYHLAQSSPCVNAGDPAADGTGRYDIDGQNRLTGARVDMGAHETAYTVCNLTSQLWYETIQQAIDAAQPGDVLQPQPGVYHENLDFLGKPITLQGTATQASTPPDWSLVETTIVEAADPNVPTVVFMNNEQAGATLTGVTIAGGASGIYCAAQAAPTIEWCIVRDNTDHGLYSLDGQPLVRNTRLHHNGGCGLLFCGGTNAAIQNSLVYRNDMGVRVISTAAPLLVRNNTIVDNITTGVTRAAGPEPDVRNCIVRGNGDDLQNCTAWYSCVGDADGCGDPNITHSIMAEPGFLDAATNEWRLTSQSTCHNAGDPNTTCYAGEKDLYGNDRLCQGTVDIGAAEVHIVRVDADATDNGSNMGTTWADAVADLQRALTLAIDGELWVAAGTYCPGDHRNDTFALRPGLRLYGGFAATTPSRQRNHPDRRHQRRRR